MQRLIVAAIWVSLLIAGACCTTAPEVAPLPEVGPDLGRGLRPFCLTFMASSKLGPYKNLGPYVRRE